MDIGRYSGVATMGRGTGRGTVIFRIWVILFSGKRPLRPSRENVPSRLLCTKDGKQIFFDVNFGFGLRRKCILLSRHKTLVQGLDIETKETNLKLKLWSIKYSSFSV